jgi:hypothetical protein
MTWLNDRQRNDLDNYITGHYGEDQFNKNERREDDYEPEIDEDKFPQRKQSYAEENAKLDAEIQQWPHPECCLCDNCRLTAAVGREVTEVDDAVTKILGRHQGTKRTIPDWEREIAWSQMGWIQNEACKKKLRRQRMETVCKWVMATMAVLIVLVTVLVAIR